EIDQFRILIVIERRHLRFQRHAADRARARPFPADLRMHRAGMDGPCRCRRFRFARRQVLARVGNELFAAARIAEVVLNAVVGRMVRRLCRVHGHAADRIDRAGEPVVVVVGVVLLSHGTSLHPGPRSWVKTHPRQDSRDWSVIGTSHSFASETWACGGNPVWRSIRRRTRGPSGPWCSARMRAPIAASSWVKRWLWRRYSVQVGLR